MSPLLSYLIIVYVYFQTGLGEGPFILSSCGNSEIVLGVNATSKYIFPLPRMSAHGNVLFNFMVTPGLFKDKDLCEYLISKYLNNIVTQKFRQFYHNFNACDVK